MSSDFVTLLSGQASSAGAAAAMREYVAPIMHTLTGLAALVCTFFMIMSGYQYMTSSGRPDKLAQAKHAFKNAVVGLVIVLSAVTLTSVLTHAYGSPHAASGASLPQLQAIPPDQVSNGLVDVLIKAVTGFLNNIIQAVAAPFLSALGFFTKATPLMAANASVFNLWLAIVGMADVLFVVVLALLGFHVMSAGSLGFDELDVRHLLPRIGLIFLLVNTSIFAIDGIIALSNALITAISQVSGASSVWETLTAVVKGAGGQGLAGLLMMLAFLIFSVILLVYYVGRLVTLFIGAVISPLILLVWLIPGFRDFSETAIKTYVTTIFTLFVHVVILQLAASLFVGMAAGHANALPDTLMAMVVGLATVIALLKTQGVMMQFSYVSMSSRNARMLGGQFMNGVSYLTGKGRGVVGATATSGNTIKKIQAIRNVEQRAQKTGRIQTTTVTNRKGKGSIHIIAQPNMPSPSRRTTGIHHVSPATPARVLSSKPKLTERDKVA